MELKDLKIPLKINVPNESVHGCFPVEVGIPLPESAVRNISQIGLFAGDKAVPADFSTLMSWPDGSLRWVLLRFIAQHATYFIRSVDGTEGSYSSLQSPMELVLHQDESGIRIDTGSADFFIDARNFHLESLSRGFSAKIELRDLERQLCRFEVETVEFEHKGRISATILTKGRFVNGRNREFCKGECRLWFWAGTALMKAAFTLWNPKAAQHKNGLWDLGDPGSIFFRSLHFPFIFNDSEFRNCQLSLNPGAPPIDSPDNTISVFQGSSGGENWNSRAHVDRFNRPTPCFRGYKVSLGGKVKEEGIRCEPAVIYSDATGKCAFAMENFWQSFPNRLHCAAGIVSVEPFPEVSEQEYEIQGGEKATVRFWADFSCADENDPLLCARTESVPLLQSGWFARTNLLPGYTVPVQNRDIWLDEMISLGISGRDSFFDRREAFDEYGWRNFGDTPADHEKQHYTGTREFVSHYNNQYDLLLGFLSWFAATGDTRWFELGRDLARHILDHDLYSTTEDKSAYNGGYFWHTAHYMHAGTATHRCYSNKATDDGHISNGFGGGPSNEHNYTSGLTLYYLMTGDVCAKDAVLQLAKWVRDMQDPWKTPFRFLSRNPTGLAVCTRQYDFIGPGRGGAYSINACLDAFLLTSDHNWLDIAERYLRICIHPSISPGSLQLLNREDRWSYVVFLQELGRYLEVKWEAEGCDAVWHYAKTVLINFARWMVKNEYPYLDRPEELEYPTSTWAAQDLRKSSVFRYAAKYAANEERLVFEKKAQSFEDRSGEYLKTFDDFASTRNLALLMSFSTMNPLQFRTDYDKPAGTSFDFGNPESFLPQKIDAIQRLRRIMKSFGLLAFPELIRYLKDSTAMRKKSASDETR